MTSPEQTAREDIVSGLGQALTCIEIAAALPGCSREYDFDPAIRQLTDLYLRARDGDIAAALRAAQPQWRTDMENAPKGRWIICGMRSLASPTGWWEAVVEINGEDDHWTDGAVIRHYNGQVLVAGFRGPFEAWRELLPPPVQETEGG